MSTPMPIRKVESGPELNLCLKQMPEMDVACLDCLQVFRLTPYAMFAQETEGRESLVYVIIPTQEKPFVCPICRAVKEAKAKKESVNG